MSAPDPQLVGWWKIESNDMPEGKVLSLIGGLPGRRVCFSETGHYNIWPDVNDAQCYRSAITQPHNELDIWIRGLEPLTALCIYKIEDGILKITVAGRRPGQPAKSIKRPTEMRRDDQLNWALIILKPAKPPKGRGGKSSGWKLEPGKLIPKGFLGKPK